MNAVQWLFTGVGFVAASTLVVGLMLLVRLLMLYVAEQLVPAQLRVCVCGHHKSKHYSAIKTCQYMSCGCNEYTRDPSPRPAPERV